MQDESRRIELDPVAHDLAEGPGDSRIQVVLQSVVVAEEVKVTLGEEETRLLREVAATILSVGGGGSHLFDLGEVFGSCAAEPCAVGVELVEGIVRHKDRCPSGKQG